MRRNEQAATEEVLKVEEPGKMVQRVAVDEATETSGGIYDDGLTVDWKRLRSTWVRATFHCQRDKNIDYKRDIFHKQANTVRFYS